jgi:hypothetical protein
MIWLDMPVWPEACCATWRLTSLEPKIWPRTALPGSTAACGAVPAPSWAAAPNPSPCFWKPPATAGQQRGHCLPRLIGRHAEARSNGAEIRARLASELVDVHSWSPFLFGSATSERRQGSAPRGSRSRGWRGTGDTG